VALVRRLGFMFEPMATALIVTDFEDKVADGFGMDTEMGALELNRLVCAERGSGLLRSVV
jgi:hypothetical protein